MEELKETAQIAKNNGFQLMIHAIGDRANREVLNLYESVLGKDSKNYRWRIEHAQHLNPSDIGRFGELGVIAAMQSIHCTSDASFVVKRIGEKRAEEGAYVWRKLTDSGAIISNGTDSPIEKVNPIPCFYAAVTRRTADGSLFYPAQKLTRQEALKTYTINGAYAAFEEDIKGSLKPGKLADFVVLSNDLLKCSEDDILNTRVLYTVVGGEIKYNQK
jgi:predicted amidohydrolase YtcJ